MTMTRRMAGTICPSLGVTNRHPKILHRSVTTTHPPTEISSPHHAAIYTGPFSDRHSSLPTNYHTGPNTSKQFHFEATITPQQRNVGVFCHRKDFIGADSERSSEQVPDEVPQRIRPQYIQPEARQTSSESRFRRRFRGGFQRRFGRRYRGRSMRRFWRLGVDCISPCPHFYSIFSAFWPSLLGSFSSAGSRFTLSVSYVLGPPRPHTPLTHFVRSQSLQPLYKTRVCFTALLVQSIP